MGTRGTLGQQLSRNVHPQPERFFTEWVSRFFLPSEAGPPKSSPHGREQQGHSFMPACSQTWMRSASHTGLGSQGWDWSLSDQQLLGAAVFGSYGRQEIGLQCSE